MQRFQPDESWQDTNYILLVRAVSDFCNERRTNTRGLVAAQKFKIVFSITLPYLADRFDSGLPAPVYGREVVDATVSAIDSVDVFAIWHHFFLQGCTYEQLSQLSFQTTRNAKRRVMAFPSLVVDQLYLKNREIATPEQRTPAMMTWRQRQIRHYQGIFTITRRQAEVLLAFVLFYPALSRKQIAEEKLFVSISTLRTHIRSIIKKMKVKGMPEAVAKALPYLIEQPDG